MDRIDLNGLTRQENQQIVNRFLDTELWVGDTRKTIRSAGKRAVHRQNTLGYQTLKFILNAMRDFALHDVHKRMIYEELEWVFICKVCDVSQEAWKFRSPSLFQIYVYDEFITFENEGPCNDCRHR